MSTEFQHTGDEEQRLLSAAIEQATEFILVTDLSGTILYCNAAVERLTGFPREETLGTTNALFQGHDEAQGVASKVKATLDAEKVWKGRVTNARKDGTFFHSETTISPIRDASGQVRNYTIVSFDVTKEAELEAQLLHAQKMESIGELASGIAHEINTPTQYIGDNIRFFQDSFENIRALLEMYQRMHTAVKEGVPADAVAQEISVLIEEIDLDYLKDEVPLAIEQSLEGNSRVAEIVRAMKEFGHPGLEERTAIDLNHAIQNTIAVARNEWKYVAELVTAFDPNLPEVPCLPGTINQVILNILVNAAHAIGSRIEDTPDEMGTITISTSATEEWAEVRIQDTGVGIPEAIRTRIFDPFFTTKPAGIGTGQGLSIVHTAIVDKHKGRIDVKSEVGVGTTFVIQLPLVQLNVNEEQPDLVGAETDR